MHAALVLLGFWAIAFVSLCLALLLLNIYSDLIDYDFTLHSIGKELFLAGICSLIEAASVWVIITYIPGAGADRTGLAAFRDLHGRSPRGLESV